MKLFNIGILLTAILVANTAADAGDDACQTAADCGGVCWTCSAQHECIALPTDTPCDDEIGSTVRSTCRHDNRCRGFSILCYLDHNFYAKTLHCQDMPPFEEAMFDEISPYVAALIANSINGTIE